MNTRSFYDCFIGTRTIDNASDGIYFVRFQPENLSFSIEGTTVFRNNPTFLVPDERTSRLFSVQKTDNDQPDAVSMFSMEKDGHRYNLKLLDSTSSTGRGPCHLLYDDVRKRIVVANYSSGGIGVIAVAEDGSSVETVQGIEHHGSSVNPNRQQGPHVHSVTADPTNSRVLVCDLGIDEIVIYAWDEKRLVLEENPVSRVKLDPGSGPRHFAFHPSGNFGYVSNEMGNTVTAFAYDRTAGVLTAIQTIDTLPRTFAGENTTADVHLDASGEKLYISNRGHDSITVYNVDEVTGALDLAGYIPTSGKTPWNFALTSDKRYLFVANKDSDTVVVFDLSSGEIPEKPVARVEIPEPVCIQFV